jgi:hypothetical protein
MDVSFLICLTKRFVKQCTQSIKLFLKTLKESKNLIVKKSIVSNCVVLKLYI